MKNENFRIPPQSIEAERSIIGSVLLSNESLYEVLDLVSKDDFYVPAHSILFESFTQLANKSLPIDVITVSNKLRQDNLLDSIGGLTFLSQLTENLASTANVSYYARIVKGHALKRKLIQIATDIADRGFQNEMETDDFIDWAEQKIFGIGENQTKQSLVDVRSAVFDAFARIEKLYNNQQPITGIETGFDQLDQLTSGLQNSDLIIVAARPSMGKTTFVLNLALHAAIKKNKKVAVFSLEMSKEQLVLKMLSSLAKIDSNKLRKGSLATSDWQKLTDAAGQLSGAPIYVDDTPGTNLMDIRSKVRRLKADKGIEMIVIDYLQLMSAPPDKSRNTERHLVISEISRGMKILAKEMNIPIIALSQLNRSTETRENKRPIMSDLRESGSIEQDADIIMFIYRDEMYNKKHGDNEDAKKGETEIIISKHRNGPTDTIKLLFQGEFSRFVNLDHEHSDASW